MYSSAQLLEIFCKLCIKFKFIPYTLWGNSVYLVGKKSTFEPLKQCRLMTLIPPIEENAFYYLWRLLLKRGKKNKYETGGRKAAHGSCWSCRRASIHGSSSFSLMSAPWYLAKASYNQKGMHTPVWRPFLWV